MSTLPTRPFDGQEFIDFEGVKWIFDTEKNCWTRSGKVPNIPLASSGQPGLMSSKLKGFVDTIQNKGGGFGIIVDPKLSVRTEDNPDGIIFGDIELVSNSLDIDCVFANGKPIPDDCTIVQFSPEVDELPPGFDVNFKEQFLSIMCAEIPGGPGPQGDEGDDGNPGLPGTGDGPQGDSGDPGEDATEAATFTSILIEDIDDIFDTAVINLELDSPTGKLFVTKSKVKVPEDESIADQLVTSPITRSMEFSDGFIYDLLSPTTDLIDLDPTIAAYPSGFVPGRNPAETQVNVIKLTDYLNRVTGFYDDKLTALANDYDKQLEKFFKTLDDDARQKLDIISEELANCEFQLPLQYCLGIGPSDCSAPGGPNSETIEDLCALAGFVFEDSTTFCAASVGTDIGTIELAAGEEKPVTFSYPGQPNSTDLPAGGYFVIYVSGTYFDSGEPGRGYFVGTGASDAGIKVDVFEPGEASGTSVPFPVSGETFDEFDPTSVEEAFQGGPFLERLVAVRFDSDGGSINLRGLSPTDAGTGTIKIRIVRCAACP